MQETFEALQTLRNILEFAPNAQSLEPSASLRDDAGLRHVEGITQFREADQRVVKLRLLCKRLLQRVEHGLDLPEALLVLVCVDKNFETVLEHFVALEDELRHVIVIESEDAVDLFSAFYDWSRTVSRRPVFKGSQLIEAPVALGSQSEGASDRALANAIGPVLYVQR